jgi:hypothetical protein
LELHYTHVGITLLLEPVVVDRESEYAIEDIIKDQTYQKRKEYLVQWKGWPTKGEAEKRITLKKPKKGLIQNKLNTISLPT